MQSAQSVSQYVAPGFVHLRVHSAYSLLEGALTVGSIIDHAGKNDMPAIGICDTRNLFGALEFSEKSNNAGLQPIVGCQLNILFDDRLGEVFQTSSKAVLPKIPLIAATPKGLYNLILLVSRSFLENDGEIEPCITIGDLQSLSEGLICLTGGIDGPLGEALLIGANDIAHSRLQTLEGCFKDRLYVEVQRHGLQDEAKTEPLFLKLAYDNQIPIVATNGVFFGSRDDYQAHDALICIAEGRILLEENRRKLTSEHYFKSRQEMQILFSDLPEALENTIEIAMRCHVRSCTRSPILPRFAGAGSNAEEADVVEIQEMRHQAELGLQSRLNEHGPADGLQVQDYQDRLEFELGIIESMKFPGYFLIVADFIKWAKDQNIPVGPGRGSGAGSLVAYSLTITDLDPLRFGLLFERFLNPERVSMPDFDIDFCQDRREEVIRYVQEKYGKANVGQIITFGTLQARAVLRDVGRVMQLPFGQVDKLCKLIPMKGAVSVSLNEALKDEPRLNLARREESAVDDLINMALKLEGLYRHASTHAAGIVIGDRSLDQLVPMYRDPRSDMPVTQYNMKWVEQAGLVKFDFLGLKTLTTLRTATNLIEKSRNEKINISKIPIDNADAYRIMAAGETVGVFQLESMGMRKALMEMKPDQFEDIIAIVALYRPGPMANIPTYCACKHGKEEPDYLHEVLEPILKETFGVIIYQEQVMQIAQVLSGYSLGQADLLRRAMGKKIASEMDKQRGVFVDGAFENGVKRDTAEYIFDLVAKFADYGFNKSHAAAYALIAYQTAYLKANYPVEFIAASMTLDMGNTDKLNDFRRDALRLGIDVKAPDINHSHVAFEVEANTIFYSLAAIKGVGKQAAEHIIEVRGTRPFTDLREFAKRINTRMVNKRTLESLAAAGAFDCVCANRAQVFGAMEEVLKQASVEAGEQERGQGFMFGEDTSGISEPLPPVRQWLSAEKLQREYAAVGFYFSAHPLDEYADALAKLRVQNWSSFENSVKKGATAGRLAGTVTAMQERKTRKGNRMGIVTISDPSGQFEALLFSEALMQYRDMLEVGKSVVIHVEAEDNPEGISVLVQSVRSLSEATRNVQKTMRIFLRDKKPLESLKHQLRGSGEGDVSLILLLGTGQTEVEIKLQGTFGISPQIASALKTIPGVIEVELL